MLSFQVALPDPKGALTGLRALCAADRTIVHQAMAAGLEAATAAHVGSLGRGKSNTSGNLGAAPTNFYSKAAGSIQGNGTANGVDLTMQRAGLSRAFRDYDLRPLRSRLLTIPVAAEAYGHRAREFSGLKWRTFTDAQVAAGKSNKAGLVLGRPPADPGGLFLALFRGAKKAHIPQDRSLLPTDEAWFDSAIQAATSLADN